MPDHSPVTHVVACLCAQWCGTCRDYQEVFLASAVKFPDAHFVWLDVEDQSECVEGIEIENFPTLFIYAEGAVRFFGTLLPHENHLLRLLESLMSTGAKIPESTPHTLSPEIDIHALHTLGRRLLSQAMAQ